MPLKLSLGWSKKIGLPAYSSLGASCHIECELDAELLRSDLDSFHDRVRQVYTACRQAVLDELARSEPAIAGRTPRAAAPIGDDDLTGVPAGEASAKVSEEREMAMVRPSISPAVRASTLDSSSAAQADENRRVAAVDNAPRDERFDLPVDDNHGATGATERQFEFMGRLARQIRGLGLRRLDAVAAHLCGKPLRKLSSKEASRLIDLLKDLRSGKTRLDQILNGAAA